MLVTVLIAGGLLAWRCPRTTAGRWCQRLLVDFPIAVTARIGRRHLLLVVPALVGWQALLASAPADLAAAMLWDVSMYLDAVIAVWLAGASVRAMAGWRWAATTLRSATRPRRER